MRLAPALLPPRRVRRNFVVMGLDLTLFVGALSFASVYGVLPLFVQHLTTETLALGVLPAVRAGSLLPPLLVAGLVERMGRKMPFVLGWTVVERLPYLVLAVATPLLTPEHPTAMLWLLFAMLAASTLAGGVATPAWLDIIARMFPNDWRGRFFGFSSALGGLVGVAGGAGAAALLAAFGWADGTALCFAAAFVCLVVSFVFIALGREPSPIAVPASTTDRMEPAGSRPRLAVLRGDRDLRWYLVAVALVTSAGAATAFYIVDAKRVLGLSDAGASLYAVVLLAASTGGNVWWGYLGDRAGHKRVVEGGAFALGLAAALAAAVPLLPGGVLGYGLVFVLVGLGTSATQLAAFTFVVDFAPAPQRPTYIGLATTAQAPFAVAAPLLGASVATWLGYPTLFALAAGCALGGAALVRWQVRDPRSRHAVPEPTAF